MKIHRTRIKICGITRLEDALNAISLGADALGFVFVRKSARFVSPETAKQIIETLPPFVSTVALFMDNTPPEIEGVLAQIPFDFLQFHGEETVAQCERYGKSYLKAIAMGDGVDPVAYGQNYTNAKGYLLDSHAKGGLGGTGDVFDWTRIPAGFDKPVILAGGLTPQNVKDAVRIARPYAVDVSSGVEVAKGIKDPQKMAEFILAVKEGDGENAVQIQ